MESTHWVGRPAQASAGLVEFSPECILQLAFSLKIQKFLVLGHFTNIYPKNVWCTCIFIIIIQGNVQMFWYC